jgi:hypothetical protein
MAEPSSGRDPQRPGAVPPTATGRQDIREVLPVAGSLAELLTRATTVAPMGPGAGKSGATFDHVRIDDEPYVVKHLRLGDDWTMRAAGPVGGAILALWRRGLLHRLPDCINQPIVAVAQQPRSAGDAGETALLMRDVAPWLVPVTDEPIPLTQHLTFLDHMAAMHAAFWNAGAEIEIVPAMHRYLELSPWTAQAEAALADTTGRAVPLVPALIAQGWALLADVAPVAASVVTALAWDPGPLVLALDDTPQTLVHGNWKLDNLGTDPDGRTIVLDWELPGRGPALSDLAWYLAINCRRLPQSKEQAIQAYRDALERRGIETEPFWQQQLSLCLLGALVQFGWEKAFSGYDEELQWWEGHAVAGSRLLP